MRIVLQPEILLPSSHWNSDVSIPPCVYLQIKAAALKQLLENQAWDIQNE